MADRASVAVSADGPVAAVEGVDLGAVEVGHLDEVCVASAQGNPSARLRLGELVVYADAMTRAGASVARSLGGPVARSPGSGQVARPWPADRS